MFRRVWFAAALLGSLEPCFGQQGSTPIVDVRFDGPYGQVLPSAGDEWAPTWGRDDVLYTANDDGTSFGGVPSSTLAFGKLEGSDPYKLKGTTINGMPEYSERDLGPERASWKSLDSYRVNGTYYRFSFCDNERPSDVCLLNSIDGKRWNKGAPVFKGAGFDPPRFIIWSKQDEVGLGAQPTKYIYAASYAGLADGDDQYRIGRASIEALRELATEDWSFLQPDNSWGLLASATLLSGHAALGPDGANWKATNTYSVDGVLYMFVTRNTYPSGSSDKNHRHVWQNSSIIKSADEGRTWVRSAESNFSAPMFPGKRFGAPYFVMYGKDGEATVDGADKFVYAVSNNGHFENADNYVLGRVPRSKLARLSSADWSFYMRGDGLKEESWSAKLSDAEPILRNPGRSGMTGMTYIPHLRRYVMVTWYYNQLNFQAGIETRDLSTVIEFFESPKPWGPWTKVKSYETGKLGWYVPVIGQRFQTAVDDTAVRVFLYPTGYSAKPEGGLDFELYKLNFIPLTLSTRPLKHKNSAYVGSR